MSTLTAQIIHFQTNISAKYDASFIPIIIYITWTVHECIQLYNSYTCYAGPNSPDMVGFGD